MTRILTNFRGSPKPRDLRTARELALKRLSLSGANRKAPITLPRLPAKEPSK